MRRMRVRMVLAASVVLLSVLAMAPPLRERITGLIRDSAQVFAPEEGAQTEITLAGRRISALQLGVYDNGEHAQAEVESLQREGLLCVIWQRTQMRLIGDAQTARSMLTADAAQGHDAWIIEEEMPEVVLRVSAKPQEIDAAAELILLPDRLLDRLCAGKESLAILVQETESKAKRAVTAHSDHLLYTQLAQSLLNWCTLMKDVEAVCAEKAACAYARATMCTLCMELRQALIEEGAQQLASTASAQRTPSTAAEVMPPA